MVSKKARTYKIQFKPAAERDLKKITDKANLRRIERVIAALASDPWPAKSRDMKDSKENNTDNESESRANNAWN